MAKVGCLCVWSVGFLFLFPLSHEKADEILPKPFAGKVPSLYFPLWFPIRINVVLCTMTVRMEISFQCSTFAWRLLNLKTCPIKQENLNSHPIELCNFDEMVKRKNKKGYDK